MKAGQKVNTPLVPVFAAQYLRASSEHQQFSTTNQSQAIALYAMDHDFQIVQTYVDEAKSGLVLKRRPGLQ
jgi:DNA invertase Pin-like site-specific DNA recombinase